jgi:hypothetical protein
LLFRSAEVSFMNFAATGLIALLGIGCSTTTIVSNGDGGPSTGASSSSSSGDSTPGDASALGDDATVGTCGAHDPVVSNASGGCSIGDGYACGSVGYDIRCYCFPFESGHYCECDHGGTTTGHVPFTGDCTTCGGYDGKAIAAACGIPY